MINEPKALSEEEILSYLVEGSIEDYAVFVTVRYGLEPKGDVVMPALMLNSSDYKTK